MKVGVSELKSNCGRFFAVLVKNDIDVNENDKAEALLI